MHRIQCLVVTLFIAAFSLCAAADDLPPVTGASGVTIENLTGARTFVTVVLDPSGAQDKNLRIIELGSDYISVLSEDGQRYTYLLKAIREVRVQEGQEEVQAWKPSSGMRLPPQQQAIVMRGVERAAGMFDDSSDQQALKMQAAVLLAVAGELQQQDSALQYIRQIHNSNDLATALGAGLQLYLAGKSEDIVPTVIDEALASGNREIKGQGALLAGLVGYEPAVPALLKMVKDRRADIAAPALRALGRLGTEQAVTPAIEMLSQLNERKGEAAVFTLSRLGGEDTINRLLVMLESSDGMTRFRLARVLYNLGVDEAKVLLRDEILDVPTLQVEAAIILAPERDIKASRILRERLLRRFDETERVLLLRARMAAALIEGGDRTTIPILQDLLRSNYTAVQIEVCQLVARLGIKSLLTILQPILESDQSEVALRAAETSVAMGYPQFRERLLELWDK